MGLNTVKRGETILGLGSGGGIDFFEASRLVGPTGRVIGIDLTECRFRISLLSILVMSSMGLDGLVGKECGLRSVANVNAGSSTGAPHVLGH